MEKNKGKALPNLPGSKDEYWEHSDVNTHEVKDKESCKHKFRRVSGTEVECGKCHTGYYLTPDCQLIDNRIYKDGILLI